MAEMDQTALARIAEALERIAPAPMPAPDFTAAQGFVWHVEPDRLEPVARINRVQVELLVGIDRSRDTLLDNTRRFAKGFSANNALLWGSRGMGKSSLVKAIHAEVAADHPDLKLVGTATRGSAQRRPAFDASARRAAAVSSCSATTCRSAMTTSITRASRRCWTAAIEGRPENVVLYATSNRRHLMPRDMIENERSSAINPSEAVEEKVSLSDRFGLWLGFHPCNQDEYLAMIDRYCAHYGVTVDPEVLRAEAIEWQATRGARSGRVAWQFFTDLAGRQGVKL